MFVREGNMADASVIARITVDTWRTTYRGIIPDETLDKLSYSEREKFVIDFLANPKENTFLFVYENAREDVLGFILGGPERFGMTRFSGEIYAIYVLENYQGKCIGKQLMQAAFNKMAKSGYTSASVWVLADNPYRHFYKKLMGIFVENRFFDGLSFAIYGWDNIRNVENL
ncbi:GNAT family N-acetyltransferase [Heliobacterium chlorum]|uniref:GNAT family N-acetyltransferase n=1 Tax=Heliobacterium chlorum TaxID=2698 RepID=A0ABR7T435_HELCL|nr:GNAT family N-acetyltransferase [Heliobacterium chlorum]MBC9785548.1 GNAT family N-acetyltransferase [Heliobacterium chlorum]